MGWVTQWSYDHPDTVTTAFGVVGGFGLGYTTIGVSGAIVLATLGGGFTYAVSQLEPHESIYGPHQ